MQLAQTIEPFEPVDEGGLLGIGVFALLLILYVPVAFGFFTSWLARERGRQGGLWFVLGFFFGPMALLSVGFAPDQRASAQAQVDEIDHRPLPPPPQRPTAEPERPRVQPTAPSSAFVPLDVDGVVFHQPSRQGYGRGRTSNGALVYFRIDSDDTLRELSAKLEQSRPTSFVVDRDDLVAFESLPPELQR